MNSANVNVLPLADRLRLAMLEKRAIETGAGENIWPIIVFRAPSDSYRLKSPRLGQIIMTCNDWGATVDALKEFAQRERVPCFADHTNLKGHPPDSVLRLITNGTANQSRVGDVVALTWDDDLHGLTGVLEAVPQWHDKLMTEWMSGELRERGFSVHIRGRAVKWRPNQHDLTSFKVYEKESDIELYSIDMVTGPAAGGRFLLPGCQQTDEEIMQAEREFFQHMGIASAHWSDFDEEE